MFVFMVFSVLGMAKAGISWNHDASLVKFNTYEYTHHFELYDAWRNENYVMYRNKKNVIEIAKYNDDSKYDKF